MAQSRGEFTLLDLEAKALKAIDLTWAVYEAAPAPPLAWKLIEKLTEVHKMVMQRMNAKYGLDQDAKDLKKIKAALLQEVALVEQMEEQQARGGSLQ